ncbi:MaoC/PaaZ C-terminal domain-containing protein [Gordonia humi]|uniref:MaoC/PaaZ C-terminal domain-containing protein n=1 Tax=Gordonia humi TaxID=686429 RepID=UPI0036155D0E
MDSSRVIRVVPDDAEPHSIDHQLDERWLLAFAASIDDTRSEVFDLDHPDGIVGHPVFPVCIEWPLIEQGAPGIELSLETLRLGLHASHRITTFAPLRPGARVHTIARAHIAQNTKRAALVATAFHTYCADRGTLLVSSYVYTLYPGVRVVGPERRPQNSGGPALTPIISREPVGTFVVGPTDSIVYTECARIWNPIHTDSRVARASGLPGTVYHGTATLARAVTSILTSSVIQPNSMITDISCRFSAPVYVGDSLTVWASNATDGVCFDVRKRDGHRVISDGQLTCAPTPSPAKGEG